MPTDLVVVRRRLGEIAGALPDKEATASATANEISLLKKEQDDLLTVVALENAKESVAALEGKLTGKTIPTTVSAVQKVENKGKSLAGKLVGLFYER